LRALAVSVTVEVMGQGLPAPTATALFTDTRTPVRRMRTSWHQDAGVVVMSLWAGDHCTATFRLPIEDAPALMHLLVDAIAERHTSAVAVPTSFPRRAWHRLRRLLRRKPRAPVLTLHTAASTAKKKAH